MDQKKRASDLILSLINEALEKAISHEDTVTEIALALDQLVEQARKEEADYHRAWREGRRLVSFVAAPTQGETP